MRTTVITPRFALDVILIALYAALLILTIMTQTAHSSFTSRCWHELVSIGWNG